MQGTKGICGCLNGEKLHKQRIFKSHKGIGKMNVAPDINTEKSEPQAADAHNYRANGHVKIAHCILLLALREESQAIPTTVTLRPYPGDLS